MAVRIRLRRMGRKKKPHYRVVVADRAKARDGGFVESLGYYQPLTEPARVVLDLERVDYWLGQGAIPSHTVRTLVAKARMGGDDTIAFGEVDQEDRKAREVEELAARRKAEKELASSEAEAESTADEEVAVASSGSEDEAGSGADEEVAEASADARPQPEGGTDEEPKAEAATEEPAEGDAEEAEPEEPAEGDAEGAEPEKKEG